MKNKINREYVVGVICIIFAIWIFTQLGSIRTNLVSNEPGPKFFPMIAAIGIIICSILSMIFDGREARNTKNEERKPYLTKMGWKRLIIIMLELIIVAIGIKWIGFLLTSMVMMTVIIFTLKDDKKINIPFAIILSIVLSNVIYFGFTKGFIIPLPKGDLWNILGINIPF